MLATVSSLSKQVHVLVLGPPHPGPSTCPSTLSQTPSPRPPPNHPNTSTAPLWTCQAPISHPPLAAALRDPFSPWVARAATARCPQSATQDAWPQQWILHCQRSLAKRRGAGQGRLGS